MDDNMCFGFSTLGVQCTDDYVGYSCYIRFHLKAVSLVSFFWKIDIEVLVT